MEASNALSMSALNCANTACSNAIGTGLGGGQVKVMGGHFYHQMMDLCINFDINFFRLACQS